MVDVEALVISKLLADPGVIALVGNEVHTNLPAAPRYPVLLVNRDGGPVDFLGHIDSATLLLEGRSPHRDQAYDVAAAALAVLVHLRGSFAQGVVSGTGAVTGIGHLIDPSTGYHRYLFRHQVFAHPIPA